MSQRYLNVERVFRGALQDKEFLGAYNEKQRDRYQHLMYNLEWILDAWMHEGVIVQSVFSARMSIIAHAIRIEFPKWFAEAGSGHMRGDPGLIQRLMERRLKQEREKYQRALQDVRAYLDQLNCTSEDAFFCKTHRFRMDERTTLVRYRACELTIREFLELQPRALLKL